MLEVSKGKSAVSPLNVINGRLQYGMEKLSLAWHVCSFLSLTSYSFLLS